MKDLPNLYYIHIGYASTIMSFYLLPVILFFKNNIFNVLTNVLKKKSLYYFIVIFLIYIFYHYYFFDFQKFTVKDYWVGLGIVHKLSLIITDNILYQEILTYFFFPTRHVKPKKKTYL